MEVHKTNVPVRMHRAMNMHTVAQQVDKRHLHDTKAPNVSGLVVGISADDLRCHEVDSSNLCTIVEYVSCTDLVHPYNGHSTPKSNLSS